MRDSMDLGDGPFILLDDARPGGAPARLYRDAQEIVVAHAPEEVRPALERVRASGLHAAGYLAYEAGRAFEPAVPAHDTGAPLLWFGLFERWSELPPSLVPAILPDPAGVWWGEVEPDMVFGEYAAAFDRVCALIRAGDLYQANLTMRARLPFEGDPLALYAAIRARAEASWGAVVATGERTLLSFSPELFFRLDGDALLCRPMKGTVRRQSDPAADAEAARALAADEKQRAENLMIVDLLRNDLARVATAGSVAVPRLYAVESYPTVHQMVSDVTARLAPPHDVADVLAAAFPCGSITGAPKIRAQQALHGIEARPRSVYTGSIGRIDANGDAQFNVAIRTLAIERDEAHAILGLGGGIVADSRVEEEWDECLAKAAFLKSERRFDLVETMAFDPEEGIALLEGHLARMKASADALGFPLDRHGARNELQAATFRLRTRARVRLLLARSGALAVEVGPAPPTPETPVAIAVAPLPVAPRDFRLRHKTTDRGFYDRARREAGAFEVLFEDGDGLLTEGSFTNLFVPRDGRLVTPPLSRGLLPGVLRDALIEEGRAVEGDLTRADLEPDFFVGNALRGLIPASLAVADARTRTL